MPGQAETTPSDAFEHIETAILTYWITGCDLVTNQNRLQPQTVSTRWRHTPNDPARMSTTVYKNLPRV